METRPELSGLGPPSPRRRISEFQLLDAKMDCKPARAGGHRPPDILPADHGHIAGLHRLVVHAQAQEGASWSGALPVKSDHDLSLDDVSGLVAAPHAQMLVAVEDGQVIGCVLVTRLTRRRSMIGLLGVDAARRRRGVGTLLIAAAENVARRAFASDQLELCVLSSRPAMTDYYRRRGFVPTGEHRAIANGAMAFTVMAKPVN